MKYVMILFVLELLTIFGLWIWLGFDSQPEKCDCTVNIGNQTMSVEDAFEYVTKGLSAHQYLEVLQAINESCEGSVK